MLPSLLLHRGPLPASPRSPAARRHVAARVGRAGLLPGPQSAGAERHAADRWAAAAAAQAATMLQSRQQTAASRQACKASKLEGAAARREPQQLSKAAGSLLQGRAPCRRILPPQARCRHSGELAALPRPTRCEWGGPCMAQFASPARASNSAALPARPRLICLRPRPCMPSRL